MPGFSSIVGHEKAVDHLRNAILSGRVSHAYMIVGDKGMGKRTLAEAFAETLQCETLQARLYAAGAGAAITENPAAGAPAESRGQTPASAAPASAVAAAGGQTPSPAAPASLTLSAIDSCGECRSCRQAETHNQPDIITWHYQKETSISVDDIRALVSDVQIKPYASRYKVYILPDAQKMTQQAQNALLKTLEEPPEYAVLVLLTTSRDAMLETILSRCVVLPLRPVGSGLVKQYLMDRHGIPDYQAEICEAFAQGNIGKAVSLATSDDFYQMIERTVQILTHISEWDVSDIVALIRQMDKQKDSIDDLLDLFTIWYRDVLLFKATRNADGIIFREQVVKVREAAQKSSYDGIEKIIGAIRTAKTRLRANVNFDLTMELLLLTMKEN